MDKITEDISRFSGEFAITIEAVLQRKSYDEFRADKALAEAQPELPDHDGDSKAPHALVDFEPDVPYKPVAHLIEEVTVISKVVFSPPEIPVAGLSAIAYPGFQLLASSAAIAGSSGPILPLVLPPGSIVSVIGQHIELSDNDFVSAGGHGLAFTLSLDHRGTLDTLLNEAASLSPISDLQGPTTISDISSFISAASESLTADAAFSDGTADLFAQKAEAIEGTFINGQPVEESDTPFLKDFVDLFKEDDDKPDVNHTDDFETPPDSSKFMQEHGNGLESPSVELIAGDNTLVNSVKLTNYDTTAKVISVAGDCVELNAIVQVNAWCDVDSLGATVNGWQLGNNPTEAFNIAMFKHVGTDNGDEDEAEPAGGFPSDWVVTTITGDLVLMNWIQQFTFMTDEDTAILSSSGVNTLVTTGDNTALNSVSLNTIGSYYDLILIGGSLYDASMINQLNVLVDNDLTGAVAGFETTGEASLSTGGNLLWNQAAIVDGTADMSSMPDPFLTAFERLAAGDSKAPEGVLQDEHFAGLGTLRVLYVTGDFLKLNYVSQTNVLGDSDQVALAVNKMLAHAEAEWTVTTGANALVNLATIVNNEATDTIYVGGQHYSDEVLIQAELISADPELIVQDPDKLVSEAVVFLDDDISDGNQGAPLQGTVIPDNSQMDPIQNMLA